MEPKFYPEDSDFRMPQKFLSDEAYTEAIESLVIVNTDVLFIDRATKRIFLPKRRVQPMSSYWLVGGRLLAGEREIDAIRRSLKRETSLDLPAERFQFLTLIRCQWRYRKQEPQDKGSDNLSYIFVAELSEDERVIAAGNLDSEEYDTKSGLQAFDASNIETSGLHPAIVDCYRLVFPN